MLPIKLEVVNFLPYRNPNPIILSDLHLACLSGANGAGKSALLDAITWALWGKARTRLDDDLIHLGQAEMSVTLDFQQDGHLYRVSRSRRLMRKRDNSGRGQGTSTLTLFGWDDALQAFGVISGGVRETQLQIDRLLRMNHDLFVNSAFLQQGRADSFTMQTPAERKRILSEILGLAQWERYEDTVKGLLRDITQEIAVLGNRIVEAEQEIEREGLLKKQLEDALLRQAEQQERVDAAQVAYDQLHGADQARLAAQNMITEIKRDLAEGAADLRRTDRDIDDHHASLAQLADTLSNADQIREGIGKLAAARAESDALANKLALHASLKEQIARHQAMLAAAEAEIVAQLRGLERDIAHQQELVRAGQVVQVELDELNQQIDRLDNIDNERDAARSHIALNNEQAAGLRAHNEQLKDEMDRIKERVDLLRSTEVAECPLCKQPLSEEHQAAVVAQFTTEGRQRGDAFRNNKERLQELVEETRQFQEQLVAQERALVDLPRLRARQGHLEKQVFDGERAATLLQGYQQQVQQLETQRERGDFAPEARALLEAAQQELATLAYSEDRRQALRAEIAVYEGYQAEAEALRLAEEMQPKVQQALERLQEFRARLVTRREEKEAALHRCEASLPELIAREAEMRLRRQELERQHAQLLSAKEHVGHARQELAAIESLRHAPARNGSSAGMSWPCSSRFTNNLRLLLGTRASPQ
ncbi:MAG: SMC family ATPase [Anaerolineae bacterium]|nr:SMC family ATPase [Anaerolineae bacterium]